MKKTNVFMALAILVMALLVGVFVSVAWVGARELKVEGNGMVSGGGLSVYDVVETDIGWNMEMSYDENVHGVLNIVEKLTDGTTRHFMLYGYQVEPVGDPAVRPILFNCATREVRIEGYDSEGRLVAASFRGSLNTVNPNSVYYWVKDNGGYITSTGGRLTVSNPFTMVCSDGFLE